MVEFHLIGWGAEVLAEDLLFFAFILFALSLFRIFYSRSRFSEFVPESAVLIFLGLIVGLLVEFIHVGDNQEIKQLLGVDPEIYLLLFIPVIIFDAAYSLDRSSFWNNFGEIVIYAVIGTLINAMLIAGGIAAFSGLFLHDYSTTRLLTCAAFLSAVDAVTVISVMDGQRVSANLFSLAFGESALNDGIAIALFDTLKDVDYLVGEGDGPALIAGLGLAKFITSVLGSLVIGTLVTAVFALLTKISYKNTYTEILILMACPMLAYILADALLFSGAIAVMTAAMLMTRYCDYNCAESSLEGFKHFIHVLAQSLEAFLFFTMGTQIIFTIFDEEVKIDWVFTGITPVICFLARAISIPLQTYFINIRRRKLGLHIGFQEQLILLWCGFRGGIAFSLAKIYSEQLTGDGDISDYIEGQMFLFSTSVLVIFTIFIFGLTIRSLLKCLHIGTREDVALGFHSLDKVIGVTTAGIEVIIGKSHRFSKFLYAVDDVAQRIFLRRRLPMEREFVEIAGELRREQIERRRDDSDYELTVSSRTRELHENRVTWSRVARRAREEAANDMVIQSDVEVALLTAPSTYE